MSKKERFFWQYNVQAKGPKGQKISLAPETVDPHVLNKVQDPVFSPYCSVDGIKHRYVYCIHLFVEIGKANRFSICITVERLDVETVMI